MIEQLQESLEAPSLGDVVRQAVRAFGIEYAQFNESVWAGCELASKRPSDEEMVKRLNVRVPIRTKERLDLLKFVSGRSFTDIIVCGLQLLISRAVKEEALLAELHQENIGALR